MLPDTVAGVELGVSCGASMMAKHMDLDSVPCTSEDANEATLADIGGRPAEHHHQRRGSEATWEYTKVPIRELLLIAVCDVLTTSLKKKLI
jgi:hypothetical protein